MRSVEEQLRTYGDYADERLVRSEVDDVLGGLAVGGTEPPRRVPMLSGLLVASGAAALVLAVGALSTVLQGGVEEPVVASSVPPEVIEGRIASPILNGPGGLEWSSAEGESSEAPPSSMTWMKGSLRTGYTYPLGWYSNDGLTWTHDSSLDGELHTDSAFGTWALQYDWVDESRIVQRTEDGWVPAELPDHPDLTLLLPDPETGSYLDASVPVVSNGSVLIPGSLAEGDPDEPNDWPRVGWVSVDGAAFEPVSLPYPLTRATAVPAGGFAVFPDASNPDSPVLTSSDGVRWESRGSAPFLTDQTAGYDIGWQGSSLVALVELDSGTHVVWSTDDGVNWVRLSDAVRYPAQLSVVEVKDFGLMAIHEDYVSFDHGVTWHETPRTPPEFSPPEGCGAGGSGVTHDMLYVLSCGVWVGRFSPELVGG